MQRDNYSSTKERRKDKSNNKAGQNEERGQKHLYNWIPWKKIHDFINKTKDWAQSISASCLRVIHNFCLEV